MPQPVEINPNRTANRSALSRIVVTALLAAGTLTLPATVVFAVSPLPVCGNSVLESGEDCDLGAGNASPSTCCDDDCKFVAAGETCRVAAGVCDSDDGCSGLSATCPNGAPINVALGGTATQSSTQFGGVASLAIDGNTDGIYANGSVTHTQGEAESWWMVDLGSIQNISEVRIWNRTDCCGDRMDGYYLFVSDVPFVGSTSDDILLEPGVLALGPEGLAGRPTSLAINRTGRYLRIQQPLEEPINIAEFQVLSYGDVKEPNTTICRAATDDCDAAELCDGTSNTCGGDLLRGSSEICRAANGACDLSEYCNGVAKACPADSFAPAGTSCYASAGPCDDSRSCDGAGPGCPYVAIGNDGALCHYTGDTCRLGTCEEDTGLAFVGFTSANVSSNSIHQIMSWSFLNTIGPGPFNYPNFTVTPNLSFVGDAVGNGTNVLLTTAAPGRTGSGAVWYENLRPMTHGFDTTFQFKITPGSLLGDGFAFVVQRDPRGLAAVGSIGSDIGYGGPAGITHSLAVEFDTYDNGEADIPNVSVHTRGPLANSADETYSIAVQSFPTMADGNVHAVRILYTDGSPPNLKVFLDGSLTAGIDVDTDIDDIGYEQSVCNRPLAIPRDGCVEAPSSSLGFKRKAPGKMKFKWSKGPAFMTSALGNPTTFTDYEICVYDASQAVAAASLPHGSNWEVSKSGFGFSNDDDDNPISASFAAGAEGKTKVGATVAGTALLDFPAGPLTGPVIAQIAGTNSGMCFSSTFESTDILKNDTKKFKAKIK